MTNIPISTLARFNPVWELCKAGVDPTRVYEDAFVEIAGDFEGANAHNLRKLADGHYYAESEPEPGNHGFSGEGYYYCIGIRFKDPALKSIRMRVYAVGDEHTAHRGQIGHDIHHCVLYSAGEYHQLPAENIHVVDANGDVLDFDIPRPEGTDTVFISDFHWWPHSEGIRFFQDLCEKTPGMRSEIIGRTLQGRAQYAFEFGSEKPDAYKILLTQTMQPSECGHLLIRYITEFLLSDDPAAKNILKDFRFYIVPFASPDGSVQGLCVSNARGDFLNFQAHYAAEGNPLASPECVAVYRYIEKVKPLLYFDMHSNNWGTRAGNMLIRYRHYLIQDAEMQRLWDHLEERLLTLEHMYHENWTDAYAGYYQKTMGYQAATRLGVISAMIKQHDQFDTDTLRRDAVAAIVASCDEVRKWKAAKKIVLD